MITQTVKLSQVSVNEANPRTIKKDSYRKLVDSILSFPEMLAIRPVVVENTMTALGGNMRCRALYDIASMSEQELTERINGLKNKTDADKARLIAYWKTWQDNPTVIVIKADNLTEEQRKEFIIKDNVGVGEWNFDMLANEWNSELLNDWGLDVWPDVDEEDEHKEHKEKEKEDKNIKVVTCPSCGETFEVDLVITSNK